MNPRIRANISAVFIALTLGTVAACGSNEPDPVSTVTPQPGDEAEMPNTDLPNRDKDKGFDDGIETCKLITQGQLAGIFDLPEVSTPNTDEGNLDNERVCIFDINGKTLRVSSMSDNQKGRSLSEKYQSQGEVITTDSGGANNAWFDDKNNFYVVHEGILVHIAVGTIADTDSVAKGSEMASIIGSNLALMADQQ